MASRFLGTSRFKNQFFQPSWEGTRFCEGVGVVKRVHSLLGGVHRLATALKEVEEVREEVQEIKDEWADEEVEGRTQFRRDTLITCVDEIHMRNTLEPCGAT